jgi:hypothetical protein
MSRPRNKNAPALTPEDREEVKAVYGELEKRVLPRNCQMTTGCCQFRLTRRTPMLTLGEALYLQLGVRRVSRNWQQPVVIWQFRGRTRFSSSP